MEEERIIEALCLELSAAERAGATEVDSFFAGLARREAEASVLVEFALRVMEGFTVEDGYQVADGCRRLLLAGAGPAEAARVRALRSSLPPLGGLLPGRDYRDDYDELVALVDGRGQGVCDCVLRARFGPPPRDPAYEIVSETPNPAVMGYFYRVRCTSCGKEWDVEVDLTYHFPHAYWQAR